MSYGSNAYGSSAYASTGNGADEQVFFPLDIRSPGTVYEARASFFGSQEFYEVLTRQETEAIPIEYKIYTSHGEGATPQLQTTVGGGGPTQSVIAAAPIIVVTAEIHYVVGNGFLVVGRPYTQ